MDLYALLIMILEFELEEVKRNNEILIKKIDEVKRENENLIKQTEDVKKQLEEKNNMANHLKKEVNGANIQPRNFRKNLYPIETTRGKNPSTIDPFMVIVFHVIHLVIQKSLAKKSAHLR